MPGEATATVLKRLGAAVGFKGSTATRGSRASGAVQLAIALALVIVVGGVAYVAVHARVVAARRVDAHEMLLRARLSEAAYFAEFGVFASVNSNLHELCPETPKRGQRLSWAPSCGAGRDGPWSRVPLGAADEVGTVDFGISVVSDRSSSTDTRTVGPKTLPPSPSSSARWYAIYAMTADGLEFATDSDSRDIVSSGPSP
jgi:hypothetical protein